jgi:hypothetical protein
MLRPSTVDRIVGLFFRNIFGGTPSLPINHIVAPVSTSGLLSYLLALSIVDASRCELLWERIDINIPLHVDRLYRDRSRGNSLVNVGLIQHKDTVVHSEFTREL